VRKTPERRLEYCYRLIIGGRGAGVGRRGKRYEQWKCRELRMGWGSRREKAGKSMEKIQSHKDLIIYQKSYKLSLEIYRAIKKIPPRGTLWYCFTNETKCDFNSL
jgi:hypothetical protein